MCKIKKSNQPKPPTLTEHSFKKKVMVKKSIDRCWEFLNRMDTFTDGQVFPYRVEFVSENENEEPSFTTGTWTNHHGPLLNICGQIGEMKAPTYRDLNYSYGSYVLTFRWIRPVRLQIFLSSIEDQKTDITIQLDCYVAPFLKGFWSMAQTFFWSGFGSTLRRQIK